MLHKPLGDERQSVAFDGSGRVQLAVSRDRGCKTHEVSKASVESSELECLHEKITYVNSIQSTLDTQFPSTICGIQSNGRNMLAMLELISHIDMKTLCMNTD